ncbi:MAG TPA: hypothetical protein VI248_27580 [Kineosporiaceae bacterium]
MKRYLRPARVALTVLTAGLVCMAPTTDASAAKKSPTLVVPTAIQTIYQRFYGYPTQNNPWVQVTGTANCPSGTRVVGVGAGNGTVTALAPTQNFTAAQMVGAVTWPSPTYGGNFIQVQLLCAPAGQLADVKTAQVNDHRAVNQRGPGGKYLRDVAQCPGGYYAFGGGGYFTGNASGFEGAYWIIGNGPTPDGSGWAFTAQAPPDGQTMVVEAQCAPRAGQTFLNLTGTSTVPEPDPNNRTYEQRTAYADCPAGYTPISGGWYIATAPLSQQAYPVDAQNYIGTTSWSVGGPQTSDSSTGRLAWYANATVMAGDSLEVLVQCIKPV